MGFLEKIGINMNGAQQVAATDKISRPQPPYSKEGWQKKCGAEDGLAAVSFAETSVKSSDMPALEAKRDALINAKTGKESELSEINSGGGEVAQYKTQMDEAFEKYQKAMSEDEASNPELANLKQEEATIKADFETNSTNIRNKDTEISAKKNDISSQETTVSGFKSELSTLQSQLNSIPANSNKKGSEEQNAALQAQRQQVQHLIMLKKEQITQSEEKLNRLQQEKEKLDCELVALKEEKAELEQKEKEVQQKIKETSSKAVADAQNAYNEAKEAYENQKASASDAKQAEITDLQSQIDEVEAQISEARCAKYEEGDWRIDGKDVVNLATQYEGLTNNEMREIFAKDGARFDNGEWCADFVTHMMNKTYGKDNTPGNFSNTCELFCSCSEMRRWAQENGRATTNAAEVKPGDAIIINTASGGLHVGMVSSVNKDGTINTIEGNTLDDNGNYDDLNPGQVNRRRRDPSEVNTYVKFQ